MPKDFYFVVNDNDSFELWVKGECITDCFSLSSDEALLMKQLVSYADIPCYKRLYEEDFN